MCDVRFLGFCFTMHATSSWNRLNFLLAEHSVSGCRPLHPDAKADLLKHAVYESAVNEALLRKIVKIRSNPKKPVGIVVAQFDLQYPGDSPLTTLHLSLQPSQNNQTFALQLHCSAFPKHIASTLEIRYVIQCKELDMDSWSGDSFTLENKDGHVMIHDSFEMYKFKNGFIPNVKSEHCHLC